MAHIFRRNLLFLKIITLIYLFCSITMASLWIYVLTNKFNEVWNNQINYLDEIKWWVIFPILTITNAIISFFVVTSIYIQFKYTNNRELLKYTWLLLYNTLLGDFLLIRPILILFFYIKLFTKKSELEINDENKHLFKRSVFICVYLFLIICYFSIFGALKNTEAIGWTSFCTIIYLIVPKLVVNSFIDIKFTNKNLTNKWMLKILICSFFGIFPCVRYLINHPNYKIN